MDRSQKVEAVEGLKQAFSESESVILVSFAGIDVPDITELRQKIREADCQYKVVKNTLALRAAEGTPLESVKEHFRGPTAIAYTTEHPVVLAKLLKEFSKGHQGMTLKAGVLDGRVIGESQIEDLAEMPSREELLSKLLFLLNAPLTRLARSLQSPVQNLAVVLKQLGEQK